ncbi:patatin-like phospholipase family protein [Reyranella sp.]|uniref:patatin-like phospholipase family protein n=1 Tax=Reyranella sp. TaxID=1929291 RepID=UPI003F6E52C9
MPRTKIAIACQGGGSQTAFTAGALKALCRAHEQLKEDFEVVAISGTSGGAVCATLLWYSFMKGERPVWKRMMDFWQENTAQGPVEHAINRFIVESARLVNAGMMPTLQLSPSSPMMQSMMEFMTAGQRMGFSDFRGLLEKHIDFAEIASWGPRPQRPVLMLGAANVTSGALAKFVSAHEPIRVEHVLASCAVPNIFPAVPIGGDAYWDGLFSDNPPVEELLRPRSVGEANIPDEIWLIKINPTASRRVPVKPGEIVDRRNQLEGNISLFQQLGHLEFMNDLILADAFRPEFLSRFDIKAPVRIPKSFHTDVAKPYHIPCIEMPVELQDLLDYEGKIDRGSENITMLIAEGEKAAEVFLRERAAAVAASSLGEDQTAGQAELREGGSDPLPLRRWKESPRGSE